MKVLVVTSLIRFPGGTTPLYPRALESIFRLQWHGRLDHWLPNGGDDPANPVGSCGRKNCEAQAVALNEGYDALLVVDHDMIVPPDALIRLAGLGVPIAYGLYVLRHARDFYRWNAATHLTAVDWRSLSEDRERAVRTFGEPQPVVGMGFGCTLIRRDVLETIPFRWYDHACTDWALALDARQQGFVQVCDTRVVCGHMDGERVFWPDVTQPQLFRLD